MLGPHRLKSFGWRYLQRLAGARARRLAKFGTVGAVGVIVNTAILQLLARTLRVPYLLGSVLATQVAILSNFTLSELFVFRAVHPIRAPRVRLAGYVLFNNCSLALTGPLLVLLVSVAGIDLVMANVLSLVTLTLVRFAFADTYLWAQAAGFTGPPERRELWRFDPGAVGVEQTATWVSRER